MTTRKKNILIVLVLLILAFQTGFAQKRTLEDLKSALVIKLCDYVSWPTDTLQNYAIGLLSENTQLINSFITYAPSFTIQEKPVIVTPLKNLQNITNFQVLFIDKKSNQNFATINELISGKGILLFTENHSITNEFMFNLLSDENKGMVSFEFNRANLIFEGFDIHNDIIELKGSEIDVRDLYRQTKIRLKNEESKVRELSEDIESLANTIKKQAELIDDQNGEILKKNNTIVQQSKTINQKELRLAEINDRLLDQEKEMEEKQQLLVNLQNDISFVNITLDSQKTHIKNQISILDTLNNSIVDKQKIIEEKDKVLAKQENEITFRNRTILLLFFMSAATIILLLLVYRTNKANNEAKIRLATQKEELQTTLNKLTQAQDQLIQSEKMASLGVLVAGIAHEINNPVNFISTGITGLKNSIADIVKVLNEYRKKYKNLPESAEIRRLEDEVEIEYLFKANDKMFAHIRSGIDRTVSIIKSLKIFSHENDKKEFANIHENIDLALTILHNQYKYNVEIKKEYGDIPAIECFPGKMNQVFVNLLTNAVQAIEDKGVIQIKTWHKDNLIHISIKDNGSGIPADIQKRVFDPFFTTKDVGKGTGMGLSLVYNIIQSHHGQITLKSEQSKYSEFIIKLPIRLKEIK